VDDDEGIVREQGVGAASQGEVVAEVVGCLGQVMPSRWARRVTRWPMAARAPWWRRRRRVGWLRLGMYAAYVALAIMLRNVGKLAGSPLMNAT
jgi:hypothetical protein